MDKEEVKKKIQEIENLMADSGFWNDKLKAQSLIKELQELKSKESGKGPYDAGDAHMTIFAGAGGDDAEDFARILVEMYYKYINRKKWSITLIHENKNDHGGFRNVTFEIKGKPSNVSGQGVYGTLKKESGVHRLVRMSPFNSKSLRHTSFVMVEVIPKFDNTEAVSISDSDIRVEFSRSGGPGGQNVNKRETAVRVIHLPTNISVHVTSERSQAQNREKALEILRGKLYAIMESEREAKEKGMYISKTTEAQWGNQIRSYVLHPYKMVKDHRSNVETSDVKGVLEEGKLDAFIEAEKSL